MQAIGQNYSDDMESSHVGDPLPELMEINANKLDAWLSLGGLSLSVALLAYEVGGYGLGGALSCLVISFSLFTTIYFALALHQRQPWRPVLTLTSQGVRCRQCSQKTIPWSSIEHIGVLELATGHPNWRLDLNISANADPDLVKSTTKKWGFFTHSPGKPIVSVSEVRFQNYSYLEVLSLLKRYHGNFR